MKQGYFSLLLKCLFVALPAVALFAVYLIADPYKVLHTTKFHNYYNWQPYELNRDFVSTQNFHAGKAAGFNAFIFGSSRSFVYHTNVWESYLPEGHHAYHYDALSETLFGWHGKVKLLETEGVPIQQALVILDESLLKNVVNDKDVIHIKHPAVSGENALAFQSVFLKSYFTDFFFKRFIKFWLTGNRHAFDGTAFQIKPNYFTTEAGHNNFYYTGYDSLLKADSLKFYADHGEGFQSRAADKVAKPVIGSKQQQLLEEIAAVFKKNGTRVEIVINPLFDQQQLHPSDKNKLQQIFGTTAVHDFSGVNEYTAFEGNYYDPHHYKEPVAISILNKIYH
ncbi:MAG: hypothetical protein U0T73_08315 [Chitinophagales bacterium]